MALKSVKEGHFNIAICNVYIKEFNDAKSNIDEYFSLD